MAINKSYIRFLIMKKTFYFLLLLPFLFAFGKNQKPQHSKYLTKHYVKVPAGYVFTNVQAGVLKINNQNPIKDSLPEFFIAATEVTNFQWKEFLMYLKQEGRMEEYRDNILDTTVWRQLLAYNEPFVDYYYQHKAYSEYPAVGMTLKQAQAYANWLTEIYALKNQSVKIIFSVPTKKQWIRAARGDWQTHYPWDGKYMRNSKGAYLTNFKNYDAANIHYNTEINKYEVISMSQCMEGTITAPAESYYPNKFGIYNMSGNVAELVSDGAEAMGGSWNDTGYDVRVESEQPATQPKSTIVFRIVATIEE